MNCVPENSARPRQEPWLAFEPDETAVNAWLSVHMLASIMKTMRGAINRTTVLVKIPTTSNMSTYGFSTLVASNKKFTGLLATSRS